MIPELKLLLYSYIIYAFPWIKQSNFFTRKTSIGVKIVDLTTWLAPLSQWVLTWGHMGNLGKQSLKKLPWNRSVIHFKRNQGLITTSSASSTYPIPESQEHHKKLQDIRVTCQPLAWKLEMTKKGEQEYKTCLENWLNNIKIRLLFHSWHFIYNN